MSGVATTAETNSQLQRFHIQNRVFNYMYGCVYLFCPLFWECVHYSESDKLH